MRRALLVLLIPALCACTTNRKVDLQARFLPDESLPTLQAGKTLALKNTSTITEDVPLAACARNFNIVGKLHDFTHASVGTTKEALERKGVVVAETSGKFLDLSVSKVICVQGMWVADTIVELSAKTGDGFSSTYTGAAAVYNVFYGASGSYENAIVDGVSKMLNDKNIIAYIEK